LVLGGVNIPGKKGLVGHSDADVLAHAVIDALLGAASMGDIGRYFPDTDPKWKDANSIEMLKQIIEMLEDAGWLVSNVDCTVIAEEPRLAPYVPQMRESLAVALNLEVDRVSVKAKTTEGMGFTGEKLGMEAYAVACIVGNPVA